jgi:hypothetical protein
VSVLYDNDRLSHWLFGALFGWLFFTFALFIPVFHLWLGIATQKIVVSATIGGLVQLVFTPWLFSARATRQNPGGKIIRRSIAVVLWFTSTSLLFFLYPAQLAQQFRYSNVSSLSVWHYYCGMCHRAYCGRRDRTQSTCVLMSFRCLDRTIHSVNTSYLYDAFNPALELNGTTPTANLLTGGIDERSPEPTRMGRSTT